MPLTAFLFPFTLPKLCVYDFCHVYTTIVFRMHIGSKIISFRSLSQCKITGLGCEIRALPTNVCFTVTGNNMQAWLKTESKHSEIIQ